MTRDVPEAFAAAVRHVAERQAPQWALTIARDAESPRVAVRVSLDHPLSPGQRFAFTADQVERVDVSMLSGGITSDPEFRRIADAPECEHVKLILGFFAVARAFDLPPEQLRAWAGVMIDGGCLNESEYEWLLRCVSDGPVY